MPLSPVSGTLAIRAAAVDLATLLSPDFASEIRDQFASTVFALFLLPPHPCIRRPFTFVWSIEIAMYARSSIQSITRLDPPWWQRGLALCLTCLGTGQYHHSF
jgi:hypothetical protein